MKFDASLVNRNYVKIFKIWTKECKKSHDDYLADIVFHMYYYIGHMLK